MLRNVLKAVSSVFLGLGYAGIAHAHGGYDPRLKLAVSESELRLEISVAADDLLEFDENKDGAIQAAEFKTAYKDIAIWIENRLSLTDQNDARLLPIFADASIVDGDHFEGEQAIAHIKIRRRYKLKASVDNLRLSTELYQNFPVLVYSLTGQFETLKPLELCLTAGQETQCQNL